MDEKFKQAIDKALDRFNKAEDIKEMIAYADLIKTLVEAANSYYGE